MSAICEHGRHPNEFCHACATEAEEYDQPPKSPRCRLGIAAGSDQLVLPLSMPRDYAEALGRSLEQMGAVTWYLPA